MSAGEVNAGKVLVVDDDADVRACSASTWAAMAIAVSAAATAQRCAPRSNASCPTWCCSTSALPGDDGITLARQLRERHNVGIIMVTGCERPVDRIVGLEVGADDYIGKPFDPRELRARIKSVLRRIAAGCARRRHRGAAGAHVRASARCASICGAPAGRRQRHRGRR